MKLRKVSLKKVVVILFVVTAVYFLVFSKYGLIKIIELKWNIWRTQQEIKILEAKEVVLRREVKLLETDTAYINKVAREKFGIK